MIMKVKATEVVHGADWDQTTIVELEIDELDIQISELEKLKAKAEHFRELAELQQERVIDLMESRAEKSHISALDGGRQATVVYGETVVYDDTAILAELTEPVKDMVTDRKINRSKLERAVLQDYVPAHVVAEHATVKPRKPFVKITEHREQEPAE